MPNKQQLLDAFDDGDITFREFFERYEDIHLQEVEQRVAAKLIASQRAIAAKIKLLSASLIIATGFAIFFSPLVYKSIFGYKSAEECAIDSKNKYAISYCFDLYPSIKESLKHDTLNNSSSSLPQGPLTPMRSPTDDLSKIASPLSNPVHGSVYWFKNPEIVVAPFEINSSAGENYFVKFSDADSGADVLGIFVEGGKLVSTKVPAGRYTVKYAAGKNWYGYKDYFGADTVYSKATALFDFNVNEHGAAGYSITLYKVKNGNLHTSHIKKEEF